MEDTSTELFYMFFDIFLFISCLGVIFTIYRSLTSTTYIAAYNANQDTVSSELTFNNTLEQDIKTDYKGYSESYSRGSTGESITLEMYDGDILGSCVLTDILEEDEDVEIFIIDGGSIKQLNTMIATGTGVNFLKYARTTSITQLQALLDLNATYQRRIEKTADGKITAIRYTKY